MGNALIELAGIERIDPTGASLFDRTSDGDQVAQLFAFAVPFLAVIPLLLGLAVYAVPLQVGARSLAFPRAASLAYFGWLTGELRAIADRHAGGRVVSMLEGGYALGALAESVVAHLDALDG